MVLEALASHQHVLVRDIPVYDEWLKNGVHCYKGKTPQEFCSLIKRIINDDLPSTKKAGFKVASERNLFVTGAALVKVYQPLLNNGSTP